MGYADLNKYREGYVPVILNNIPGISDRATLENENLSQDLSSLMSKLGVLSWMSSNLNPLAIVRLALGVGDYNDSQAREKLLAHALQGTINTIIALWYFVMPIYPGLLRIAYKCTRNLPQTLVK